MDENSHSVAVTVTNAAAPSAGAGRRVHERLLFSLLLEAVFGFSLKLRTDALMAVPISGKRTPQ